MLVRISIIFLVFILLSGCASTKRQISCSPKFQLVIDKSLHLSPPLQQPRINKYLDNKNLNKKNESVVTLKLVKGYVKIYNMVLEGHAVLKVDGKKGKSIYFRGADTDSNIANTDGEWRSVFEKAVKNAIEKAELKYAQCTVTV